MASNSSLPNGLSPTVALARQSSMRKSSNGETSGPNATPKLGTSGRLVDYEALIRHFDCPVCHDWVTPPITQCRKGHIVCGPCKSKGLKACPICKQRFSEVPNWMMEQVKKKIKSIISLIGFGDWKWMSLTSDGLSIGSVRYRSSSPFRASSRATDAGLLASWSTRRRTKLCAPSGRSRASTPFVAALKYCSTT